MALAGITGGYVVWSIYGYLFDTSMPVLDLAGIRECEYCAGDVSCSMSGGDSYKVADISIALDGKPLVNKFKINKSRFDHPFSIPTKTLVNGKHTLAIEVADASRQRNCTRRELTFYVDNAPLQGAFVRPSADLKVFQGRTLHVQFQVNKEISEAKARALSKTYNCVPESPKSLIYECFIPISTEEVANEYPLVIEVVDHVGNTLVLETKFQVVLYPFKKQNLTVNNDKVAKENEIGLPIRQFELDMERVTAASPARKLWLGAFYPPCDIRGVSTEFGTVRTSQQRGKYSHDAIDLLGTPKSVVWAPQDGVVVIKARYAHAGNTVGIDHGNGIISLLFHLDNFSSVEVGDSVRKGNPMGTLGMTGHASGYHLHWEMRVNNVAVDPMQWTRHDF